MTTHVAASPTWASIAQGWRELAARTALYSIECDREGLTREANLARRSALNYLESAEACELGTRLVEREAVPA